jgi:peptidoglycan/LPS O-acetylase OafA/YrhL
LEWWIYFLFPGLVLAWRRFGAAATTFVSIAFSVALSVLCLHKFGGTFSLQYIGLFVLGMVACEIVYTRHAALQQMRDWLPWGLLTGFLGAGLALAVNGKIPHLDQMYRSDLLAGVAALCLLVTLNLRPDALVSRILSHRLPVFLGSFAYSIYLIHAPLIQVI